MVHRLSLLALGLFLLPVICRSDIEPNLGDMLPVYVVEDIQGSGNVQALKEGRSDWAELTVGQRLEEGDQVRVGEDTELILSLKNETLVHLDEGTELQVAQLADNGSQGFLCRLKLALGSILSDVKKNLPETHSAFEVEAGGVVCGVRGTAFEVSKNGDHVETTTHEGTVEVKTPHGTQQCKAGQTCSSSKGHLTHPHPCSKGMKARFQAWKNMRQNFRQHIQQGRKPGGLGGQRLGRSPSFGGRGTGPGGRPFKKLNSNSSSNSVPGNRPGPGSHR